MTEQPLTRLWSMRFCFAILVCVILFFHLLPLHTTSHRWVGPDLLLSFAFAWSIRRPEYVPILGLAGLFLLADFLLQRPPGLWATLALLTCEHLKGRARGLRETGFVGEWLSVCILITVVCLGNRVVLIIMAVDVPQFSLTVFEAIMTMVSYPLVAAITHGLMGVRRPTPGDLEHSGGLS